MRLLLSLLLLAAPGPAAVAPPASELADAEAKAMVHVRQAFERIGRSSPVSDPALTQAARTLAREALLATAEAASGTRIGLAVSEAGGWDPNPRLVLIRSWPTETTLQAFFQRNDFKSEPATHAGVALVGDEDQRSSRSCSGERRPRFETHPRLTPVRDCSTFGSGEHLRPRLRAPSLCPSQAEAPRPTHASVRKPRLFFLGSSFLDGPGL